MKKKVLITGISSLILKRLSSFIDLSEYKVIGISRNPMLTQLNGIEVVQGDICDINSFAHHIQDCYMIIHGAAITHSFNKTEYYKVNLNATKKLVDVANTNQVKRFIFISSNTAGTSSGAYGLTKLLAEEYIQENFNGWTIFRPSEIYGSKSNEGIDKLINDVIDKSIIFCPLAVPTNFFPIHMEDAVRLMFENTFDDTYRNEIIVVNGLEGFSFLDVIELTKSISNKKIRVIFIRKKMMFVIKRIVEIIPFYVGIIPDQIDRLYSIKYNENSTLNLMKFKTYIEKVVETRK
jgi:nucleoside-diphosphate-sugar epimerase